MFDDPASLPADRDALTALGRRVGGADLAAPPVVLPDFHHKSKMELPSSVAVATRRDDPARPDRLLGQLRHGADRAGLRRGPTTARWSGSAGGPRALPLPDPGRRKELSVSEVRPGRRRTARSSPSTGGAHPAEDLERIEEGGRLDLDRYGGLERLTAELPSLAWQLARLPLRHRRTQQPLRRAAARRGGPRPASGPSALGVREGQLTIQYHGGGGVLTGELGRLFFRRKDYPRQIRAVNLAAQAVVPPARRPASLRRSSVSG